MAQVLVIYIAAWTFKLMLKSPPTWLLNLLHLFLLVQSIGPLPEQSFVTLER